MKQELETVVDWVKASTGDNESSIIVLESENKVNIITKVAVYSINVDEKSDYLGAIATPIKLEPGKDWHRGDNLTSGTFNKKTWNKISADIKQYEEDHKQD